jgi:uncharacterized protein YjaZ
MTLWFIAISCCWEYFRSMGQQININYVKTESNLSVNQKNLLEKTIKEHALIAGKILRLPFITITVYPKPSWTIPETGENGFTPSAEWIQIYIDPKNKLHRFDFIAQKIIPGTIYHEMSHAARWRTIGYGNSLLEAIISEGLASAFEKDQWSELTAPWLKWQEKEIKDYLKIFKKRKNKINSAYNHGEWFFVQGNLPKWIGYKIGAYIVESARNNFPKLSWYELNKMEAKLILKKSKIML